MKPIPIVSIEQRHWRMKRRFDRVCGNTFPCADGPVLSMRTCLYTNSPDSHFIVDVHPENPNVILACGFSGHGFKFASVVGEILEDLALKGRTGLPARFLGVGRFEENAHAG